MSINPNVLTFKPRQVQLLSSASPQIMSRDNHLLLHSIARYLEQSGLSKTLKKFRSEANINQDDLGTSSFDLEEMFRNFLETCSHANKKLESHQVQETLSNKKKKKKDDCDVDVAEKSEQEQNVDSEILKKSPDKKCKNKKKSKSKLDSDPLADDIEPAAKELPGLTVKKSQDGQTSEDNVVTDSQTKTKSKDKKKKKNKSSDHAVEDVHLKTDVMNASGEDMTNKQDKLSKKRKRLTSEEDSPELANEKEVEDSKCSEAGTSKKPKINDATSCKISTEKHNEEANGYIEMNAGHSATLSTMKKQRNGSSEDQMQQTIEWWSQQSENVDDADIYLKAVGGRDRRGRIFGLGSFANTCYSQSSTSSTVAFVRWSNNNKVKALESTVQTLSIQLQQALEQSMAAQQQSMLLYAQLRQEIDELKGKSNVSLHQPDDPPFPDQ